MIKLEFDTRLFLSGMDSITPTVKQRATLGMSKVVTQYKNDALNKPPAAPRKTGWLAGHHVTNVTVLGNIIRGSLSVVDTPYAVSLHEGISRWGTPYKFKTPGTGMKWIESKILMYKDKYTNILLESITQGLITWSNQVKRFR